MKSTVYSWRVSSEKKAELASEARREGTSMAELLEEITTEWLRERRHDRNGDDAEQAALRKRVMATVGTIRGGDPTRSQRVGKIVKEIIREKHERETHASRRTD